jgi:S-adenosylmethionine:tRNA ribosyltransferase-isomerase
MQLSDFDYSLPDELIAQRRRRGAATAACCTCRVAAAALRPALRRSPRPAARPGDLLVFNDTRVIPARLFGRKDSGGRVEILIERVGADDLAWAQVRASKPPSRAA